MSGYTDPNLWLAAQHKRQRHDTLAAACRRSTWGLYEERLEDGTVLVGYDCGYVDPLADAAGPGLGRQRGPRRAP